MKNNTTNLVPTGHEVGTVTTVSGEILASSKNKKTKKEPISLGNEE